MVEVAIPDLTTIITQFVLVGGLILGAVKWLENKSEKKSLKEKEEAEQTARELKEVTERTTSEIKKITEDKAREALDHTDHVNQEMKTYTDSKYTDMSTRITEIDKKVVLMREDLGRRADFTNGSVASIRTDIADLQEELEELQDRSDNNIEMKRHRDKKRREKRRTIERDRIEQSYHH